MINFKTKYCFNDSKDGERLLGRDYFKGFKKRNAHRIVSKRGQKYEMDRDNWTTYRNFSNMSDNVIEEMCDAGVAEKLDSPVWMDRDGKECQPIEAFGCKVTHRIKHPDICVLLEMKLEVILVKRVMVVLVVHYMYAKKKIIFSNLKRLTKINVLH